MLSETDKTEYSDIVEDLHTIARRLAHLADCGFGDMEGADMPEFQISEELYGLDSQARQIANTAEVIAALIGK